MTSLLRQLVAGPRVKHEEAGLDLCYVTSKIIATSGPSQTYPQRAYRNPLDRLVAFLDKKHGDGWAIWEFRAEGTGYPDEAVYHRIRHYPWPDHHPPPFRLVPMIMASMRNWLAGGDLDGTVPDDEGAKKKGDGRVVVVHCKAGKGRSGTMACSYLISECGWTPEDALARFTERRMRPKFGAGVSIPSQLRWVSYVDRWTKGGKRYVDREVEIVEVHVWGLRHGVKVSVEGFEDEGKKIKVLHTFKRNERIVVEGDAPGGAGVVDFVSDLAGYGLSEKEDEEIVEDADYEAIAKGKKADPDGNESTDADKGSRASSLSRSGSGKKKGSRASSLMRKISTRAPKTSQTLSKMGKEKSKTIAMPAATEAPSPLLETPAETSSKSASNPSLQNAFLFADPKEPGGQAVIFKPETPIKVPNGDVNVSLERRNRAHATVGLTMVTAVAHVWFNTFFEGNGPEQDGTADDSGVFEIDWDKMDGIKGSSQRGTRACDRLSVVWRVAGTSGDGTTGRTTTAAGVTINEPPENRPVPQMRPADWKGGDEDTGPRLRLGLRTRTTDSASVSAASSVDGEEPVGEKDDESLAGVKVSGPLGEEVLDDTLPNPSSSEEKGDKTAKKGFIIE